MLASVVFIGAVLCSVGFMAWLAFFILNRGFNTSLETRRESWRISRNYLAFGVMLLAGAVGLGYQYSQMEAPLPSPEIVAGASMNRTPDAPGPSEDKTLVAGGMVLSGVAFLLWLGAFAINRSFNTSLRSAREGRRNAYGQLTFGAVLLGLTLFLAFTFFQIDRPAAVPETAAPAQAAEGPAPAAGTPIGLVEQGEASKDSAKAAAAAASAHAETADAVAGGEGAGAE